MFVCWNTGVCYQHYHRRRRRRRRRQEMGSKQENKTKLCWSTGVCYQLYHRRRPHRHEGGSEQEDIKTLFVGVQESVVIVAVVVVVKRWGLDGRPFLSGGAQVYVINIIIAVVVIVKRWGLNRRTFLSVKVPEEDIIVCWSTGVCY